MTILYRLRRRFAARPRGWRRGPVVGRRDEPPSSSRRRPVGTVAPGKAW